MTGYIGSLACVRCDHQIADTEPWDGCPACRARGLHSNVLPLYDLGGPGELPTRADQPGIFRFRELLPVRAPTPVSLGEGGTAVVASGRLAKEAGVATLAFKDETRNPSWSYKDRLAAVAVTVACERGADTVALATTGNHGAAAAAYAAAAGLRCVVLTLASVPTTMKVLMQSYGAEIVAFATPEQRWQVLAEAVSTWGWVPLSGFLDPPVGSNPFGVDGYKTIAYELHEQLDDIPDVVVVPAAYGDGLAGIARGFEDLLALGLVDRLPRMVAADPFGAYARALASGGEEPVRVQAGASVAFSVATSIATYQGLAAIRRTRGAAAAEPDDQATLRAQRRIAATTGLYLEASAALCLPAVEQLVRRGELGADDRVVCIATSTGLKDVDVTAAGLPPVPTVEPTLAALAASLGERP